MLEQAAILRCMDHFASRQDVRAKNLPELKTLEKLHRHTRIPRGALAFAVLRAYQERSTASKERGLVEVYGYVKSIAPHLATCEELDLLTAFRSNTAKRARSLSAELVADSLLALQSHVAIWNQTSRG